MDTGKSYTFCMTNEKRGRVVRGKKPAAASLSLAETGFEKTLSNRLFHPSRESFSGFLGGVETLAEQ